MSATAGGIDPTWFRQVLGQYPTGVSVVTGIAPDERPVGLVVGTFTSVSLDPPLVAFLPGRTSSSWPKIEASGHFCINVLSAEQEDVCRVFATKEPDKFQGLAWRPAGSGSPVLAGCVAWIDCKVETVHEAGDHYIVVGRVLELDAASSSLPLLFFQGGYGRFAPGAMATLDADLSQELHLADRARPVMERMASSLGGRCHAMALVGEQIVVMAGAGQTPDRAPRLVGERTPLFPPIGTAFMAFAPDAVRDRWLDRAGDRRADYARRLDDVRARGYSLGLRSPQHAHFERMWKDGEIASHPDRLSEEAKAAMRDLPYDVSGAALEQVEDIRSIHVPVFGPDGHAALVLNFFPGPMAIRTPDEARRWIRVLLDGAGWVTDASGGRRPG